MMRIWMWPVAVALVSTFGLLAGLVSEGAGDWLCWLSLSWPVWIATKCLARDSIVRRSLSRVVVSQRG